MKNVKTDFGAVGNYNPSSGGGADDTAAFASAFTSIASTLDALYIPPGNYKITAAIGSTTLGHAPGYNMFGDGMYLSVLYMIGGTSSPGGATLNISGAGARLAHFGLVGQNKIQNLVSVGFATTGQQQGDNYALLDNCRFGTYSNTDTFVNAIYANMLKSSSVRNCFIYGKVNNGVFTGNGINFYESVNNRVTGCQFDTLANGISITAGTATQGLLVQDNVFISMGNGIAMPNSPGTAFISVTNNIIDYCQLTGVTFNVSGGGGNISGNYVGLEASSPQAPVAGIFVANSKGIAIGANTVNEYSGSASQNTVGVALFSSPNSTIVGNTTISYNTAFYLDGSSNYCTVIGNSAISPFATGFSNSSTGSAVANNTQS